MSEGEESKSLVNKCANYTMRRKTKRTTTAKMYGYRPQRYESEWSGGDGCTGSGEMAKSCST